MWLNLCGWRSICQRCAGSKLLRTLQKQDSFTAESDAFVSFFPGLIGIEKNTGSFRCDPQVLANVFSLSLCHRLCVPRRHGYSRCGLKSEWRLEPKNRDMSSFRWGTHSQPLWMPASFSWRGSNMPLTTPMQPTHEAQVLPFTVWPKLALRLGFKKLAAFHSAWKKLRFWVDCWVVPKPWTSEFYFDVAFLMLASCGCLYSRGGAADHSRCQSAPEGLRPRRFRGEIEGFVEGMSFPNGKIRFWVELMIPFFNKNCLSKAGI